MTVEVVSVWAPRNTTEEKRQQYLALSAIQERTANYFGHPYRLMTDDPRLYGGSTCHVELPEGFNQAMIAGVIKRLEMPVSSNLVFVDLDVLIARGLDQAFTGDYDLGLTHRVNPISPINNGVMYIQQGAQKVVADFFRKALAIVGTHWGGDQEAISQIAAPVPQADNVVKGRFGARVKFFNMKHYAAVPKVRGVKHSHLPYAIHFKGETKPWMEEYATKFILSGPKWA